MSARFLQEMANSTEVEGTEQIGWDILWDVLRVFRQDRIENNFQIFSALEYKNVRF